MSDRYGRALGPGCGRELGVELMGEGLDDAGAKSGLSLSENTVRLADPIIGDRKLPIRSDHIIGDGDPASDLFVGKRMLERVHDELGHDQAESSRPGGR